MTARPDCSATGLPADLIDGGRSLRPDGCLPGCARHRNILLYDVPGRAGILDRGFLFARLGNLAGSLCAHVVTARPCEMFAVKHNNDEPLNCTIGGWNRRYINLTFADGDPVLRSSEWHAEVGRRAPPHHRIGLPGKAPPLDRKNSSAIAELSARLTGEWRRAAAAAFAGQKFEWRLRDVGWASALQPMESKVQIARRVRRNGSTSVIDGSEGRHGRRWLHQHASSQPAGTAAGTQIQVAGTAAAGMSTAVLGVANGSAASGPALCPHPPSINSWLGEHSRACVYVRHHAAPMARLLADRFMMGLRLARNAFNVLHIRRNDKADPRVCNTTIERVAAIVRHLPPNRHLVIFTDERR